MGDFQRFLDKTTRVGIHNAVMAKVNAVEQEIETELNRKRDRLRTLISMEDQYYARTLRELQQKTAEMESQRSYDNLEKMLNERETERQKLVEMKRKQQHLLNCHELRQKMQQALLEESKKSQLQQIEEKRLLKQIEKDEKDMWLEIERRTYEDKLFRERMEQSIQNEQNACTVKCLNWQVASKGDEKMSKRQEIDEERRLNVLKLDEMKSYDARKRAELVEKQREFSADCKKQIEARHNAEKERRARDLNYEKMLAKFIQAELDAAEAKKISDKERRRVESGHFFNYVEQQKIDMQLTEKEQEDLVNAYRRKIDEEAWAKQQELEDRRRMFNEEVYACQLKQIALNREQKLRDLNEKRQEQLLARQTHLHNMAMEEAAALVKRQQSIELRNQLLKQTRERELQLMESKNDLQDDIQSAPAQHACDVDDVVTLHPHFQQILSLNKKMNFPSSHQS